MAWVEVKLRISPLSVTKPTNCNQSNSMLASRVHNLSSHEIAVLLAAVADNLLSPEDN